MRNTKIYYLDKAIYFFLCINALCLSFSTAGANVGAGGACLLFIIRVCLYRDDIVERLNNGNKWILGGFAAYMAAVAFSIIGVENISTSLKFYLNNYVYRSFPLLITFLILTDKTQILRVLGCLVLSVCINNLWTIGEFGKAVLTEGDYRERFSGNIHPVHFGALLSIVLPALFIMGFKVREIKKKIMLYFLFIFLGIGLYLSGTRGAWLSIGLVTVIIMAVCVQNKKKLLAGYVAAALALGGLFVFNPFFAERISTITDNKFQSNTERVLIWQSAFNMYMDHLVNGIGTGCYKEAYQQRYISPEAKEPWIEHAHNNILHTLAESGTIGGGGLLILIISVFVQSWKNWRKYKSTAGFIMFMVWLSFMLQGMTEYNIGTIEPSKYIWLSLGLYLCWLRMGNKNETYSSENYDEV